jgi:hypothetical protein
MSWQDLLQTDEETATLPWVGGQSVYSSDRTWKISNNRLPKEFGWYRWTVRGRWVADPVLVDPDPETIEALLKNRVSGYLVGDRIVPDDARVDPDPAHIVDYSEKVYLIEPGLDRFVRVKAGRVYPEGPLIYVQQEFPLGPEDLVMEAYLDQTPSVAGIASVPPALDAAFRMEDYQRTLAEERRRELERLRREEEEQRAREERRRALQERLGDGAGRRAMAKENFAEAAAAALQVGGAELLDHRPHRVAGEWVIRYRVDGQRLECTCDDRLRIISAGFCLTAGGVRGDDRFTLESISSVAREAMRTDQLVINRYI